MIFSVDTERGEKMSDLISRQDAIDALLKALYEYEDKTEKQFQESDELDIGDWIQYRIFVQNMSDIDRQTILALPSAEPVKHGYWIGAGFFTAKCSVCDAEVHDLEYGNYCPICGAKMDLPEPIVYPQVEGITPTVVKMDEVEE